MIHEPQNIHNEACLSEIQLKSYGYNSDSSSFVIWKQTKCECVPLFIFMSHDGLPIDSEHKQSSKAVLPQLWSFDKHAEYGSEITHPCLAILIQMLKNSWISLRVTGLRDSKQKECILVTHFECLKFGLVCSERKKWMRQISFLRTILASIWLLCFRRSHISWNLMTLKPLKLKAAQTLDLFLVGQKALKSEVRSSRVWFEPRSKQFNFKLAKFWSGPSGYLRNWIWLQFFARFREYFAVLTYRFSIMLGCCCVCPRRWQWRTAHGQCRHCGILVWLGSGCRLFHKEELYPQERTLHRHSAESFS